MQRVAPQAHLVDDALDPGAPIGGFSLELQCGHAFPQDVDHAHARVERGEQILKNELQTSPMRWR
ncbi:MAG: hypothetical protein HY021_01745 [Burkholderiales bacterium]|nr:hypothetical protein [Burkholderiales bacterium]